MLPCKSERIWSQEGFPPPAWGQRKATLFGKRGPVLFLPNSHHSSSSLTDISLDTSLSTQQTGRFRQEKLSLGFSEPVKKLQCSALSKISS